MRLLHCQTLTFSEFNNDDSIPSYSILSHTWGSNEVTYNVMLNAQQRLRGKETEAFKKILYCAEQTMRDDLSYFWIDTCCIDKTSSAEVSEAINSMYRWYQRATVCYAYLSDVPPRPVEPTSSLDQNEWVTSFRNSRWFTRGWTLQELISPRKVIFYSSEWEELGEKASLAHIIEARTGIPVNVLVNGDLTKTSVAQKMSWAADRITSRGEDMAYCLMGIFDVNMPMLYGEGAEKAFIRLQEEIIRLMDDMSIFAWVDQKATSSRYRGLLARSPSEFAQCRSFGWARTTSNPPYLMTNRGVRIDLPLTPRSSCPDEYTATLRGLTGEGLSNKAVGIYLRRVGADQFARVEADQLALHRKTLDNSTKLTRVFVRRKIVMEVADHSRAAGIKLRIESPTLALASVQPPEHWIADKSLFVYTHTAVKSAPPKATFCLRSTCDWDGITLHVDATKEWGSFVSLDDGWRSIPTAKQPHLSRLNCRKPSQPLVEISLQRDLFDDESLILLVVKREERKVPGNEGTFRSD